MMRNVLVVIVIAGLCLARAEARAAEPGAPGRAVAEGEGGGQLGGISKGLGIAKKANDVRELRMTDAEEQELGKLVSEKIRVRYGVVQDADVHRYVSLVGLAMAQGSTRPALPWTFVVLDTDGANAFAAPGGYVHITRGLLGLIKNEAELAGVLAHEIIHITEKHTIREIQKSQAVTMGAQTFAGDSGLMQRAVSATYDNIINKGFGRADENEADEKGAAIANKTGYAASGLVTFLTTLKERNKSATEKRGLFASHPEMQERLDRMTKQIAAQKLTATATLQPRYAKHISYKPVDPTVIATVEEGAAGLTGGGGAKPATTNADAAKPEEKKAEEPKRGGRFGGLSRMVPASGGEKKQAQVVSSGGARGLDPEKDSKGGSNPAVVTVRIAATDVAAFKKEGGLS
jgi:predicted Zn-dependent protease